MLKKLFISLIILSALTSEGMIVLPGHYYDFFLFANVENELGLKDLNNFESSQADALDEDNGLLERVVPSNNTVLSCISKSKNQPNYSQEFKNVNNSPYSADESCFVVAFFNEPGVESNKDLIIKKADSSPPSFVIDC